MYDSWFLLFDDSHFVNYYDITPKYINERVMSIASAELYRLVCPEFKSILVINLLHLFFPFPRQQSNHIGTHKCLSQKIGGEHLPVVVYMIHCVSIAS